MADVAMWCAMSRPFFNTKLVLFIRELLPRLLLIAAFLQTEKMSAFNRHIHPDEMWLYRNPRRESYVSNINLWCLVIITPFTLALIHLICKRDKEDFIQTILAVTLSMGINGILTNMIKLIVGRPRPDFFWRCFPDGEMNSEMQCTGPIADVIEGRKSFPSGHSSISFSSLATMSWWLMGKLHVWSSRRGSAWRLLLSLAPLIVATLVALSRTCDYHHHWQDVTVGSFLGLVISYGCYRQHFPSLDSHHCHKPYTYFNSFKSIMSVDNSKKRRPEKYFSPSLQPLSDVLIEETDQHSSQEDEALKTQTQIKEPVKWI